MNWMAMTLLLVTLVGLFVWQARRRWALMTLGPSENRTDQIGERLKRTWQFAFAQQRMRRYWWAGIAHMAIFFGFLVLLFRSLVLFGRGYSAEFEFWGIFSHEHAFGMAYSFVKDVFIVLVILGTLVFCYYRLVARLQRMTLSFEGALILLIILTMMVADVLYDGAHIVRAANAIGESVAFSWVEPAGSVFALALQGAGETTLKVLLHIGFWTHVSLVLIFLNLLPISKHFHVITAIPNVFTQSLAPRGQLPTVEDIEGKIEREETLGLARIDQLTWKAVMDLYTCTECGRCTEQCPAANTGKLLSPKQLTLDLRDYLYNNEKKLVAAKHGQAGTRRGAEAQRTQGIVNPQSPTPNCQTSTVDRPLSSVADDLVPEFIKPEVVWACTTCGACETECPVFIKYVDKIVDIRRNLVMERAEFPSELQNAFKGLETCGNPWSFPASDRAAWTEGLDVPLMAEKEAADVLFWVGCSASFDDRAKKIARAMACLLKEAGVDFAILGEEEQCTGDAARRAGNEFLFQMLAQMNVETMGNYKFNKIVTVCPHCYNMLAHEYPDFGGHYEVVHHSVFLSQLVREGRLKLKRHINAKVAWHDSCYLGRYNEIYDAPRETLHAIPGLIVLEPRETRDRGLCCGAGGAQMFKEEEEGKEKVYIKRTGQLLETRPDALASACPFCQRMLLDGLADMDREDVAQFDIAELLWKAVEPEPPASGQA
ncbi:MAG: (Fe-S)-binding protein [Phycisphaerae bacterium]|nr:(Fe-S)-binding protein [Phycisphaerae bacterium]